MSWRRETAAPVHVLRVTLERLLDHLSVQSSSFVRAGGGWIPGLQGLTQQTAVFPVALCPALLTPKDVRISLSSQPTVGLQPWLGSSVCALWTLAPLQDRSVLLLVARSCRRLCGPFCGGKHIIRLSAIHVNGRLGHFQSGAVMNGALVIHSSPS